MLDMGKRKEAVVGDHDVLANPADGGVASPYKRGIHMADRCKVVTYLAV